MGGSGEGQMPGGLEAAGQVEQGRGVKATGQVSLRPNPELLLLRVESCHLKVTCSNPNPQDLRRALFGDGVVIGVVS